MKNRSVFFLVAVMLFLFTNGNAQWSTNSAVNNAISTASLTQTLTQFNSSIISDGAGGAIIAWYDYRNGISNDIYAQRINAAGVIQWTANGVAISTGFGDQLAPTLAPTDSGGAIITWQDNRSGTIDIYAQRINASGMVEWTTNGIVISNAANNQMAPNIVSDDSSGAIITWRDDRNGAYADVYAQRVNASGTVQWTSNGVAICTAADNQYYATIISDDSSGAIIAWQDNRNPSNADIYAQHINASGIVQWATDGVVVSSAIHDQWFPTLVSDDSSGAIITWYDGRNGNDNDIYAQRINASGVSQWISNGVAICTATGLQILPYIISNGSSGAIIVWYDDRNGIDDDVYAQNINASGVVQWTADGVAISTAVGNQNGCMLAPDGNGGAIISWEDRRSGGYDIYAQRVSGLGTVQWTTNGVAICTAPNDQPISMLVADSSGGAIIAWTDNRSGAAVYSDIYAQDVFSNGALGSLTTGIDKTVIENQLVVYPNPGNGEFTIQSISEGDYSIVNAAGQTIQLVHLNVTNNYSMDIKNLSDGIYFIVGFNDNQITRQKVVVTK